jgi:hypothetical protein
MKSEWFDLGGGYDVLIGPRRRKNGVKLPDSFLILGPAKTAGKLRPTICSGEVIEGKAQITRGVLTVELRERLAASIMAYCVERDPSHGIPF